MFSVSAQDVVERIINVRYDNDNDYYYYDDVMFPLCRKILRLLISPTFVDKSYVCSCVSVITSPAARGDGC